MCHVASMAVVFGGLAVIQLRLIVPVTQSTSFGSNNSDSHGVTVGCILFGILSEFIKANFMKNIKDIDPFHRFISTQRRWCILHLLPHSRGFTSCASISGGLFGAFSLIPKSDNCICLLFIDVMYFNPQKRPTEKRNALQPKY